MFDPERLLKQMMGEALSGSLGGKKRRHHNPYGQRSSSSSSGGLGGMLGGLLGGSRPAGSAGGGLGGGLGGLLGGSGGRGGLSTATKAKIGLGALGVAIAAYEHYRSKPAQPATGGTAPPPPPVYNPAPPPPPPSHNPVSPVAMAAPAPEQAAEAMHLLRAMICAANADGLIDAEERERILGSARQAGLDAEDIVELEGELAAPLTVPQLVARTRPGQREPVYVASVIAIGRDTDVEVRYLDDLGQRLGLDAGARQQMHDELGL